MMGMVAQHQCTGRACWSSLSWFICLSTRLWASPPIPPIGGIAPNPPMARCPLSNTPHLSHPQGRRHLQHATHWQESTSEGEQRRKDHKNISLSRPRPLPVASRGPSRWSRTCPIPLPVSRLPPALPWPPAPPTHESCVGAFPWWTGTGRGRGGGAGARAVIRGGGAAARLACPCQRLLCAAYPAAHRRLCWRRFPGCAIMPRETARALRVLVGGRFLGLGCGPSGGRGACGPGVDRDANAAWQRLRLGQSRGERMAWRLAQGYPKKLPGCLPSRV